MTGPEHYHEAERLLAEVAESDAETAKPAHDAAQVHATLALAAATALRGDTVTGLAPKDWVAWNALAGVRAGAS